MKYFYSLLILFFSLTTTAQIDQYLKYQKAISFAETQIIQGNPQAALKVYKDILLQLEGNFAKDIYNAMLVADELNDTATFYALLSKLQPKGFSNEYINSLEAFKDHHFDRPWVAFQHENANAAKPINYELKAKLDQLEIRDQQFRILEGSYEKYGDTIAIIDQENIDFVLELIEKDQFPGEQEIGVRNIFGQQPFDVIFHHYTQNTSKDRSKKKITDELIDLALAGKISANQCAYWIELQNDDFPLGVFDVIGFKVDGKPTPYFIPKYSLEQVATIDRNRQILGLDPLSNYHEKFIYNTENPEASYIFSFSKASLKSTRPVLRQFLVRWLN